MIRVALPAHLRDLAQVEREVHLDVDRPVTQRTVLDALEARFPPLRYTRSLPSGGKCSESLVIGTTYTVSGSCG